MHFFQRPFPIDREESISTMLFVSGNNVRLNWNRHIHVDKIR